MYEEAFSEEDESTVFSIVSRRANRRSSRPSDWKERISDPEFHVIRQYNKESAQWERVYFYDNKYVKQGRVRHAITGKYFNIRAGDLAENLLFKVFISLQKDPYTLFFHTPLEYERHFYVDLSPKIKRTWHEKQAYYYRILKPSSESAAAAAQFLIVDGTCDGGNKDDVKCIIVK
jgi:hypothetical protein